MDPAPTDDDHYTTTILPDPGFGPTDANCYRQIGGPPRPVVRHLGPSGGGPESYLSLNDYRDEAHFEASKGSYPPGLEAGGTDQDPRFTSLAADGTPDPHDDVRLQPGSPAAGTGLRLDGSTTGIVDPLATPSGPQPDLGCYPLGPNSPALEVGVEGRRKYPQHA